jgi:amidohydrolase/hippurate hydrolase
MFAHLTRAIGGLTDRLVALRRQVHRRPELGFEEHETAALLAQTLRDAGLDVRTGIGGTGIVAIVSGEKRGKCLGLRADMDALPIQEATGLPFASEKPGVMHACGHDLNVAMVLGAALVLQEHRSELRGKVKIVLQPAEEVVGGAKRMIEDGVLERPRLDAMVAVHTWHEPVGTVTLRYGENLAAADTVKIIVLGRGAHAAMPHRSHDPVVAAASIILALQQIVGRRVDPVRPVVVSLCRVEGGSAFNIIPEQVSLLGTVRSLGGEVQDFVEAEIKRIARDAARAYGCRAKVTYTRGCPALIHDEALTHLAEDTCREVMGSEAVLLGPDPCMGAEDFAFFAQHMPVTQIAVGIATPGRPQPIFHHPGFIADEGALPIGAKVLACVAWRYLNGH